MGETLIEFLGFLVQDETTFNDLFYLLLCSEFYDAHNGISLQKAAHQRHRTFSEYQQLGKGSF
ncbi:hypothetical protein [Neobacillus sp. Marseille-QA0830]